MNPIRRILCPCDFSDFSRRGLEYATALAKWYGAEIVCLYVHPATAAVGALSSGLGPVPVETARLEDLERDLREFAKPAVAEGVVVDVAVLEGSATAQILNHARWMPADLVVMGTHGRGGFERWVLGSVTEKVLRKAQWPVLTVSQRTLKAPKPGRPPFQRILVGIDFSASSQRALEFAMTLAQEGHGKLTLLHAIEALPETDQRHSPEFDLNVYRRSVEDYLRKKIVDAVPAAGTGSGRPEEILVWGRAYKEILRLAAEKDADLIVLGVQGRNPLDLMMFGSTTEHVVRAADCPVLTIRAS